MPVRPASACNRQGAAARRQQHGGSRVHFRAAPAASGPERKPVPVDPLPDSDDDQGEEDLALTLTPRTAQSALAAAPPSTDVEAKWWHVPDARIEELVHTLEDCGSSPEKSPRRLAKSASYSCPSSICRPLAASGKLKRQAMLSDTWPTDGDQTKLFAGSLTYGSADTCAAQEASQASPACGSSCIILPGSLAALTSPGMAQRPPFDNRASGKQCLSDFAESRTNWQTKPLRAQRPATAPLEKRLQGARAVRPGTLAKRPATASGCGRDRSTSRHDSRNSSSKLHGSTTTPMVHSGHRHVGISAHDRELIQLELAFHDNSDRVCILIHPDTRIGLDPGVRDPSDKTTLKGIISKLTGMPPHTQRLLNRGFDVGDDQATLRKVGISHGNTVTVHTKKDRAPSRDNVVLACTAKRLEKQQARKKQESRRASFSRDKETASMIMPKWGWGVPHNSAKTGIGFNNLGQNVNIRFENQHAWHEDEPGLLAIRASPVYTQPLEYVS